jgi:hypothetical protein
MGRDSRDSRRSFGQRAYSCFFGVFRDLIAETNGRPGGTQADLPSVRDLPAPEGAEGVEAFFSSIYKGWKEWEVLSGCVPSDDVAQW